MAAKENNRFVKIYAQGALVQTEIWVDTVTGGAVSLSPGRKCLWAHPAAGAGREACDRSPVIRPFHQKSGFEVIAICTASKP